MDQAIRNLLQRATQAARTLLEQEYAAQLEGEYDILPDGTIAKKPGPHLDAAERLVRGKLVATIGHRMAGGQKATDAVADYTREAAFTCLNRFVALKMLEARELVQTCVSKGDQSGGFREFCGLAPGLTELPDSGYQLYLECLFDELSTGVKVLFDRRDPASLLWPRRQALLGLLEILNQPELAGVWIEDETIGWVYQYFNSQEERRQMREESQAPRNSRELAVRNQFFTPRYVVQFLTDNTLGRIWYEMRQGRTSLVEKCQYLVRRPDEVFLGHMTSADEKFPAEGCIEMAKMLQEGDESAFAAFDARDEAAIQRRIDLGHCVNGYERHHAGDEATWQWMLERQRAIQRAADLSEFSTQDLLDLLFLTCRNDRATDSRECKQDWYVKAANEVRCRALRSREVDLSQEELLHQPVFVSFRPQKDPRDLKVLDPACGSGHFLLYCFDLLQTIYEEAWNAEEDVPSPSEKGQGEGNREPKAGGEGASGPDDEGRLPLRKAYPTIGDLRATVPGLILQHNLHGIDIDPRCAQIAAFALWMRAQRAYNDLDLERDQRLPIRKTNIVVAEPMPGEEGMFKEFVAGLREDRLESLMRQALEIPAETRVRSTKGMADSLCALVRTVWEKMKLAGEAGSLLQIEQELAAAVVAGREEWEEKLPLFRMTEYGMGGEKQEKYVKFVPDAGEDFWHKAEKLALEAVRTFAQTTSNGVGFRKRLFVDDAERGFAFIDLCRQRYDVVLMNPPFGEVVQRVRPLIERDYPHWSHNLLCAFIERAVGSLAASGLTGAVYDRTANEKSTYQDFREHLFLGQGSLLAVLDLGWNVLDANVEVAVCVVAGRNRTEIDATVWGCDLREVTDKQRSLTVAVNGTGGVRRRIASLRRLPNAVIGYFFPVFVLRLFDRLPNLADSGFEFFEGHTIMSDRYFRYTWELPPETRLSASARWCRLFNGVPYSRYYYPLNEAVAYGDSRSAVIADSSTVLRNIRKHKVPGVGFGKRGDYLDAQILPAGFVSTVEGKACLADSVADRFVLLAVLNSRLFQYIINLYCGQHKYSGYVSLMPYPLNRVKELHAAGVQAERIVKEKLRATRFDETSPFFEGYVFGEVAPHNAVVKCCTDVIDNVGEAEERLNECIYAAYEIEPEDALIVDRFCDNQPDDIVPGVDITDGTVRKADISHAILSYVVGRAFGRWLAISARGEMPLWEVPDFAPADRQAGDANTLNGDSENHYLETRRPVALVDDEGHPDDMAVRLHDAIFEVWPTHAEEVLTTCLAHVGATDLRVFVRTLFFSEHLRRYSQIRRAAPVYWCLCCESGQYAVWLYYHRVCRDTFYTTLKDFVRPKVLHEEEKLARMRTEAGGSPTRTQIKELEMQEAFVSELTTYHDEIERIAPLWNPDLNDGVIINFAPLWRLVPQHKAWQKECKDCWDILIAGDYDWAHLAMHLWPERVVPKCRDDRSLAIAHGLEDLLWVEDYERWRALGEPDDEIEGQKKRRRLKKHDQLRSALAALARGVSGKLAAAELWKKLEAGDLDDTEAALLLWPGRVVEKCVMDPRLADKLHVTIPKRKTEAAVAKLIKRYEADGCGHLAEAVGRSLSGFNTAYPAVWKPLETGGFDDQPLALTLWPDRVVDKCVADRVLAEKQGLTRFFWYDDPWSEAWRRRQSPEVEVAAEIAHRHKPAVKAALESLLSAPPPGNGTKRRRR